MQLRAALVGFVFGHVLAAALVACERSPERDRPAPARLSTLDVEAELAARAAVETPSAHADSTRPTAEPPAADPLTLRARILDERAEPVAGARIAWNLPGEGGLPAAQRERRSEPSGSVSLVVDRAGLPAEEPLWISFDAPGRVRLEILLEAERWSRGADVALGEVTLEPAGTLAGRVLDAAGAPFAGALVAVSRELATRSAEEREWGRSWSMVHFERPTVRPLALSDAAGRFSISGVPLGRFDVVATGLREGLLYLPDRETVQVGSGDAQELARDLVLAEPAPSERIEGVVRAPDGAPVPEVVVGLRAVAGLRPDVGLSTEERDYPVRALTSPAGRFVLPLPPGLVARVTVLDPQERWPELVQRDARAGDVLDLSFEER